MWLLENDGDVFLGRRLWLRPGKKFIFGRTLADAGGFVIENKTISRKHLIVEVSAVEPDDSTNPDTRSQIILEDLNTKIGTLVDGNQIRGQRCTLTNKQHDIKLGQFDKLFRITWHPIVLTFSLTIKELKADPLPTLCGKLGSLDIKVLEEYSREHTTHVVAKKRNTSKGLQALINGKYIVDHTFIDAITTVTNIGTDMLSPLEADFSSHWPHELNYLPSRGTEPTQRSPDAYAPDSHRQDIFEGYTFIFCDQLQFENLLAPITNGRGKALLRHVDPSKSKTSDFVRFVKSVAGEKGINEFEDRSEGKGTVVVKYQPGKGSTSDWYAAFGRQVALQLDHRLVEQKEFLDAILNNDASILRKPLELEQSSITAPPPSTMDQGVSIPELRAQLPTSDDSEKRRNIDELPSSLALSTTTAVRKLGRSRRTIISRFKGFDDDFDMATIPEAVATNLTTPALPQAQVMGLITSQLGDTDIIQMDDDQTETNSRSSRKRPLTIPIEYDDEGDLLSQLAPAASNLKRRRLADELERKRRGETTPPPPPLPSPPPPPLQFDAGGVLETSKPKRKGKVGIDVLEIARQRHEKEEAITTAEHETLQEAIDGMDIRQIRNLAIVEEMEVSRSAPPPRTSKYREDSGRWDNLWNGRKNFKKFQKNCGSGITSINKVIVPLEEVKRMDFGIGDEYWLHGDNDSQVRRRGNRHIPEVQTAKESQSHLSTARSQTGKISTAENHETMASSLQSQRIRPQNMLSDQKPQNKRGPEPMIKPAPAKKSRQSILDNSDESEDGLGFRFRRR